MTPGTLSVLVMLVGVIVLIIAFMTRGSPSAPYNYLDLTIMSLMGLLMIGVGYWDYRRNRVGTTSLTSVYILLILGIITFFLFSHVYGTPWLVAAHLYIFPISFKGNPFYWGPYFLRDQYSLTTYSMGFLVIILSLGEWVLIRRKRGQTSAK
jgi:hypothetical protein